MTMRDELHLMELVDRYLDGSMTEADRSAFEARAEASNELRLLIEDQRALREGVQRLHLRSLAVKAAPKGFGGGAVAGLFAIAAIIGASYLLSNRQTESDQVEPEIEEVQPVGSGESESEPMMLPDTLYEVQERRIKRADTTWVMKQIMVPVQASESAAIEHMADSILRSAGADSVVIRPRVVHPDSVRKLIEGDRIPRLN